MADTHNIEKAVLSSILYDDEGKLSSVILNENLFNSTFNKAVISVINLLKEKKKPTDELTVAYYLEKNNLFNESLFTDILTANPFGTIGTLNNYISILKREIATRIYI